MSQDPEGQTQLFGVNPEPIPEGQLDMIRRLENNESIVIDLHRDSFRRLLPFLNWVKSVGRFTYIGRCMKWSTEAEELFPEVKLDSRWKNRRKKKTETREQLVERFRAYLMNSPDLLARLPQLRGRVLGCWCHPATCHGDVLLELIEKLPKPKTS